MNGNQKPKFSVNRKWVVFIAVFSLMFFHSTAYSKVTQVKIGVLALRGAEETLKRWTPTAAYLSAQIPAYSFVIVPLDFEEINDIVEHGEVDFILTNSGIYIELEYLYEVDRIATLVDLESGQPYDEFGGVIFTRKDRNEINNLDDLKNKSFMAVHETSFGGWITAQREFVDHGIDPYKDFSEIQFGGTHDMVVYAVQSQQVDAGTVRTGILEKMDEEGKIDIEDFTVLNQQQHENFSLQISTRLYPEWPIARVNQAQSYNQLAKQLSIALLSMPSDSQAALSANIAGWTIPHNYQSVHDCFKELQIGPYEELGKITLTSLLQQYGGWIAGGFIGVIGLAAVTTYIGRLNRRLYLSTAELEESHNKLERRVEERTSELSWSNQQLKNENRDRKLAEEELRRYEHIVSSSKDMLALIDKEFKYIAINSAYLEAFQTDRDEMIGKTISDLFGKEFFEEIIKPRAQECLTGEQVNYQNWFEFQAYGSRLLDVNYYPYLDNNDDVQGFVVNGRDITKRELIKDELQESEFNFRLLAEHTQDWEYWLDPEGNYLYNSPSCEKITGYRLEEFIANSEIRFEMIRPDYLQKFHDHHKDEDDKEISTNSIEFPIITKNGEERWLEHNCFPIFDEQGDYIGRRGNNRDITERVLAEKNLKTLYREVEQRVNDRTAELAAANEELEAFSYSVSHDLRAPLRAIRGFSEIIQDECSDELSAETKILFDRILAASHKMSGLIEDMLILSRLSRQEIRPEMIDLAFCAKKVIEDIGEECEGREVDFQVGEFPPVQADPSLVEVLLTNLITNASKFTRNREQAMIKFGYDEDEKVCYIKDNGIGFDMEFVGNLFVPFQRLHAGEEYEGTGIGLAIVKRIIDRHDGDIWVDSEVDQGTTVYFKL